jgi:succinyl-CoA synthetase beta subunit
MGHFLYEDGRLARQAASIMAQLYSAYQASGATLAEINPLILNPAGEVKAIDAKMSIDDNALFRLPEVEALRDLDAENPAEIRAREAGLSYIQLDGNVGCCVNGAGLAMATMDLVKYYGGDPANFLDIGGSSNPEKVVTAIELMTEDSNVKSILFNIFGGITRCDDVARGIVEATRRIDVDVPITIRLTGTNEELGVQILEENGFEAMVDMDRAVEISVKRVAA